LTSNELGYRPSPDEIRWHLFETADLGDETLENQRVRWEAYHCQDLLQIAAAALLEWATDLMAEVDNGRPLREIQADVLDRLQTSHDGEVRTWSDFRTAVDQEKYDYRAAWSTLTRRQGVAELKAWDAIGLIAALDQRMRERPNLHAAARLELRGRGSGRSIVTELDWFSRNEDEEVCRLIAAYMAERIVKRHSWVAMQKLRRQRDYTFLFEVRDGRLVRRSGYAPVATTPRLNPATTFLEDIWLMDENGPTARGRTVLGANE